MQYGAAFLTGGGLCCFDGPAASGGVRLESEGFGPTDMVMYWTCACEG